MTRLFIFILFLLMTTKGVAQLGTAPNFNLIDIDNQDFNLYEVLDSNKLVILFIGATWSRTSYNFHNQFFLEELYAEYGPMGTDQIRVLFVECDAGTTIDDIDGLGGNTLGSLTANISYPIANPIDDSFPINFFAFKGLPAVKIIRPEGYEITHDVSCVQSKEEIEAAISESITLIQDPEFPLSTEISTSNISCFAANDGSISIDILGGTLPYSIEWEGDYFGYELNNLSAGNYVYQLNDAYGIQIFDTVTIIEPAMLQLDHLTTPEQNAQGNGAIFLTITGGKAPYDILWNTGETDTEILNLASGFYSVAVVDSLSCEINEEIFVDLYSSISKIPENKISVYPNPARDRFSVGGIDVNNVVQISMIDTFGKENILDFQVILGGIEVSNLSVNEGIYFLRILSENAKFDYVKILIL